MEGCKGNSSPALKIILKEVSFSLKEEGLFQTYSPS